MVLFGGACMVLFGDVHGFMQGGHAWFYWGHAWFYVGGHAWFYAGGMHGFMRGCVCGFMRGVCVVLWGGMHGFIQGACVVFSVFSDTMRYGQLAGGTHPTGMHSCYECIPVCRTECYVQ